MLHIKFSLGLPPTPPDILLDSKEIILQISLSLGRVKNCPLRLLIAKVLLYKSRLTFKLDNS